jgi:AcrR family transcriptional regulator
MPPSAQDQHQAKRRRLDRLREVQRAAILDSAEEIFAATGYHEAKMSDIASKAGFSTGAIYNYFTGKEDIFLTLMSDQLEGLWEQLDAQIARPGSFMELIERLTSVYTAFMDEHRRLFVIIHRTFPAMVFGPAATATTPAALATVSSVSGEIYRRFTDLVLRVLQRGMDDGLLRTQEPRSLAVMLIAMMDSMNQHWLQESPPRPFADALPVVLDVFLNGVRA